VSSPQTASAESDFVEQGFVHPIRVRQTNMHLAPLQLQLHRRHPPRTLDPQYRRVQSWYCMSPSCQSRSPYRPAPTTKPEFLKKSPPQRTFRSAEEGKQRLTPISQFSLCFCAQPSGPVARESPPSPRPNRSRWCQLYRPQRLRPRGQGNSQPADCPSNL